MKSQYIPSSIESAAQDLKRAKAAIKSKQDELTDIKLNGLTIVGSIEFSNFHSFTEIVTAVNELIAKKGDWDIKWRDDVAEYTYPATDAETEKAITNIEKRITELQQKVDFIMNFISEKMEQVKIDIEMHNYYNS